MDTMLEKVRTDKGEFHIYYDYDETRSASLGESFDFGDKQANDEYKQKFLNEELACYGVCKMKPCECCGQLKEVDAIWGIHAESPTVALAEFLTNADIAD